MNKNTIFLTIGVAAVLAVVLAPSLATHASAVPAPRETQTCTQDSTGRTIGTDCPGESQKSPQRTESCTPRNRGADADCSGAEVTNPPVNPP
jgi:hypothetical protein